MRYDLAALSKRKTGKVILQPIEERLGTAKAYIKAMRAMLRALTVEVRNGVLPAYRADRLTRDVDESTFQRIRALSLTLANITGQTVERILRLESIRHTETFRAEARRALGVDITAIVRDEDLEEYLRRAIARNTGLIKSVADDVVKRIEQSVLANEIAGRSVKDLKSVLVEQFGIVDRRAQLIARDQTAKLNSDMNQIRQQQAGIEEYQWSTSHDERVRPLHKGLDGNEYEWGKPTGAESGLPPGQPIQCRCVARGIVEFGDRKKPAKKEIAP